MCMLVLLITYPILHQLQLEYSTLIDHSRVRLVNISSFKAWYHDPDIGRKLITNSSLDLPPTESGLFIVDKVFELGAVCYWRRKELKERGRGIWAESQKVFKPQVQNFEKVGVGEISGKGNGVLIFTKGCNSQSYEADLQSGAKINGLDLPILEPIKGNQDVHSDTLRGCQNASWFRSFTCIHPLTSQSSKLQTHYVPKELD